MINYNLKSNFQAKFKFAKENMFLRLYILLIITNYVKCELQVVNRNTEREIFIRKFILQQFRKISCITVLHNASDPWTLTVLQDTSESFMSTVLVDYSTVNISAQWNTKEQQMTGEVFSKSEGNILILRNTENLCDILKYSQSYSFFNTRGRLVLIITDSVKVTDSWLRGIFTCLWKVPIINVGVLFYNEGRTNIYTYIPWTDPFVLQNFTRQTDSANIFYNKLKNLHGYPIKLVVEKYNDRSGNKSQYKGVGLSSQFLSSTLARWNVSVTIEYYRIPIKNDCLFKYINGTTAIVHRSGKHRNESLKNIEYMETCPFSLISSNKSHNVHNTDNEQNEWDKLKLLSMFNMDVKKFETSIPVVKEDFCLLVPAGGRIPQAYNFFLALNILMWLHIVLCLIVYSLVLAALQSSKHKAESRYSESPGTDIRLVICCILGKVNCDTSITKQEILKITKRKSFLLPYIIYCFFLNSGYKSTLVSLLTKPLYYRSLHSLKDLNDTNLQIRVMPDNLQFILKSIDFNIATILLPRIEIDESIYYHLPLEPDVTHGYFMRRSTAIFLMDQERYRDHIGHPLFHLMDECPVPSLMAYLFPRGSPLMEIINKLLIYSFEGFLEPSYMDLNSKKPRWYTGVNCYDSKKSKLIIPLTVNHLQTIFFIHQLGCWLALVVFFIEIYIHRKNKRQNKRL